MADPKVSIGLPVYNGEKYLKQALDSLLNQDFEDFELIISDNASTDRTAETCRAYAARDKRIRYYRNESNIGSAPNYRRVFELARSDLFKWFAHDDVCFPSFLRRCYTVMKSAPADVVLVHPLCEFIGEGGEVLPRSCDRIESKAKQPYRRLARVLRRVSHGGPLWGVIRSDYLRRTQLTGPVSYWDDLLLAELSLIGEIWEIPEVLFQVRCYGGNAVAVASAAQGSAVARDPGKANRKTRRALLAWTDPSRVERTMWLPVQEERCLEYLKRVRHVPLSTVEKLLCYQTVPAVCYWRRLAKIGGLWKRRLVGVFAGVYGDKDRVASDGRLRAGELVEVRSKDEILKTLDKNGCLDELPFMPEMFAFCGRRFRVFKRAHKTCDTVNDYKGRRMKNAVHLEVTRCDGQSHGGCEAGCLVFWKDAWLRKVSAEGKDSRAWASLGTCAGEQRKSAHECSEADVLARAQRSPGGGSSDPVYVCQATQVPAATEPLGWWDVRQYIEDYTSGNVGLARMARGFIYRGYQNLIRLGIGLGPPLRWFYDVFQGVWGGIPYPNRHGKIPVGEGTPTANLDLQPGELVRVKNYKAILATCDQSNKNRGMTFDAEMVPYCGGTFRVRKRVTRIINERTRKMQALTNPCIVLDDVVCQARYSACRLFCPRSIYPYWREVWLERLQESPDNPEGRCR